ncbi:c-type cytochrome [Psychrobacter sp. 1U2]|uniref:c-type cytochrome n=1 Tax=Psychrobacter sp. 1U2 TaxID=3453577 RepID=UPI003F46B1E8
MNIQPAMTLALSLSMLLGISACSDNTAAEDDTVSEPDVAVVDVAEPEIEEAEVAEPEIVEPVDEVAVIEADTDTAAEPEILAANAGETLYNNQCKVCHDNGLLNAPKYGDKAAWSGPLAKDKQTLYSHSAQGFNKMPAQAVNGVSEAQVKAAVDYMLEAVS